MAKRLNDSQVLTNLRLQTEFFDDFHSFTDTQMWTETSGDTGASWAIDADGVGGVITGTTGATDNNEALLESTNELVDFLADRPVYLETRLKYTEANTDDANIFFGLHDAPGANVMQDDGAGPTASYSGVCFFKIDGGTAWQVESSVAATQTTSTTKDTPGGGTWQRLGIEVIPTSSTNCEVGFFVDGAPCLDSTTSDVIRHSLTYTSITEMALAIVVKAGGANSEVLDVDYVYLSQKR